MVLFPKFIGEFISRGSNIKTHLKLPNKLIMINLTTHFSCGQRGGIFQKYYLLLGVLGNLAGMLSKLTLSICGGCQCAIVYSGLSRCTLVLE